MRSALSVLWSVFDVRTRCAREIASLPAAVAPPRHGAAAAHACDTNRPCRARCARPPRHLPHHCTDSLALSDALMDVGRPRRELCRLTHTVAVYTLQSHRARLRVAQRVRGTDRRSRWVSGGCDRAAATCDVASCEVASPHGASSRARRPPAWCMWSRGIPAAIIGTAIAGIRGRDHSAHCGSAAGSEFP